MVPINGMPYSMKKRKMCEGNLFFFKSIFLNMRSPLAAYLSLDDLRLHATEQGVTRTLGL